MVVYGDIKTGLIIVYQNIETSPIIANKTQHYINHQLAQRSQPLNDTMVCTEGTDPCGKFKQCVRLHRHVFMDKASRTGLP